jgi:toxin ParE1/3/4
MKPVEFHSEAQAELDEAVGYYESKVPGLGIDLREDVEAATKKIQASPMRFQTFSKRTRRFLLTRFPYQIVFMELSSKILILAVSHGKRRPGYWHGRL